MKPAEQQPVEGSKQHPVHDPPTVVQFGHRETPPEPLQQDVLQNAPHIPQVVQLQVPPWVHPTDGSKGMNARPESRSSVRPTLTIAPRRESFCDRFDKY